MNNYLPCCHICNRARWSWGPKVIRKVLELGVFARDVMKQDTKLGRQLKERFKSRRKATKKRRVANRKKR